jgi:hypothetical protein
MGQQSVRQAARKTALDVPAARRVARAQRERRLDALAVELHVALGERDAAVAAIERRAGQALRAMTGDEGLTLREAVDWCGAGLTIREASRLRQMAAAANDPPENSCTTRRPRPADLPSRGTTSDRPRLLPALTACRPSLSIRR